MKKKPPKAVDIGGFPYRISYTPNPIPSNGIVCIGLHQGDWHHITIQDHGDALLQKEVVLHEIMHAIWDKFNVPNTTEEATVNAVTRGILSVLRNNPKVVEYLTSDE